MFWIISAILVIIALACILPALFKKEVIQDATREQNISIAKEQLADLELRFEQGDIDEKEYQESRDELELSLFNDLQSSDAKSLKNTNKNIDAWLILLLVPLITIPVYLNLGNLNFTKEFDPKLVAQDAVRESVPLKADGTPDVEKITQNLKLEMESNPTDPRGWYMLGRSYMLLKNFPEAVESFDKSLSLRPDLADTMLSLADALSMTNKGQLIGRPRKLVNRALTLEPGNITALWLSGMAASQAGEYLLAIDQWEKVLNTIGDKADEKAAITNLIGEATKRLTPEEKAELANTREIEKNNKNTLATTSAEKNDAANSAVIEVSISLSEELKSQASPEDFIFVYAKAMSGPPMPLAAVRRQVKDLPLTLKLNDEMAMIPDLKLSSFNNVSVGARISKTGQPIPQNGDLFTEKTEIKLGESVSLEINEIYKK